ncbi:MAG: methionyl-tRNA formyltransferase [Christensenellaceae bacterium]
MKIVFFGTPDFAVETLQNLISSDHEVLAVVTQPDKPVGRFAELKPSPVKECAVKNNVKCLQYDKVSKEGLEDLKELNADIFVTCAFGQILSQELIDIPEYGVINVHASLLPKYRGASPIQHAVLNGDSQTGVTIMQTDAGLDTGDVIISEKTDILENETSSELFERLSHLGAALLLVALDKIENKTATFTKQDNSLATYVKMIKKSDAVLDFTKNCKTLHNFVRGMLDWPCAFTYLNDKILKVFKISYKEENKVYPDDECGVVLSTDKTVKVRCKDGYIEILSLQLEGSKRMDSASFILGRKIKIGDKLGL